MARGVHRWEMESHPAYIVLGDSTVVIVLRALKSSIPSLPSTIVVSALNHCPANCIIDSPKHWSWGNVAVRKCNSVLTQQILLLLKCQVFELSMNVGSNNFFKNNSKYQLTVAWIYKSKSAKNQVIVFVNLIRYASHPTLMIMSSFSIFHISG